MSYLVGNLQEEHVVVVLHDGEAPRGVGELTTLSKKEGKKTHLRRIVDNEHDRYPLEGKEAGTLPSNINNER